LNWTDFTDLMPMPVELTEVVVAVADLFHVNPLLAATWWLGAVVLAGIIVYTWQRLLGS
jgi:hypothetical protein